MRDVRDVDTSTDVLGATIDFPLLVAPSAVQRIAHPEGELATARAAREAGVTMVLSMNASTTMEEVAAEGVRFWMQLYVSSDRDHMRRIVERAAAAGAAALCITVDHAGMPTRLRELRRPLVVPPDIRFVHLAEDPARRGIDRTLTWDIVEWLRSITSLPLVLKGVLHPVDGALAADRGVEAVIVSNHGGRQLDGTVSSYDVLEAVLEAVAGRSEVLVDGGIRSGTDLMKALALGARAGLIGRPIWWGLTAAGQAGVARVLELVRTDFAEAMRLCGVSAVDAIQRDLLWNPGPGR
jgi:4-hydroxymandelate oxidase